jgi:hypothetical protein
VNPDEEILRSPEGLRVRILRGTPEDDEVEVLGLALDRHAAWDQSHQPSTWATAGRPGIGLRAWPAGTRWSNSLRSAWEQDR